MKLRLHWAERYEVLRQFPTFELDSKEYPELVDQLQKSYDQWWESAVPLMVNENLPKIKDHPFHLRYEKQLEEQGIPEWAPVAL